MLAISRVPGARNGCKVRGTAEQGGVERYFGKLSRWKLKKTVMFVTLVTLFFFYFTVLLEGLVGVLKVGLCGV